MAKVLIVEDDTELADTISRYLQLENHTVEMVARGGDASHYLSVSEYDVIVLDLGLPDKDGIDVLREYRNKGGNGRVLILTGRGKIEQKERGLDSGADDYLTKPFHVKELCARVRALLRRGGDVSSNILKVAGLEMNTSTFSLTKSGTEVPLTRREFALLEFLMRHPEQVFSAEAILTRVWQSDSEASPDTIKVYINRLRSKLGEDSQACIKTVYGVGYKLEVQRDRN
ncbi:MAG TPA: response regulator transcription factor [Candidatus Obscuribacterales bacterium]